jgi:hypothetical protein
MFILNKKIQVLLIIIVSITAIAFFSLIHDSFTYKDVALKINSTDSIKQVVTQLLQSQEDFFGNIEMKYIDIPRNVVEIKMANYYIGDDSIMAEEYIIKVEHKDSKWNVIDSKYHWKCRDLFFSNLWTTNTCS